MPLNKKILNGIFSKISIGRANPKLAKIENLGLKLDILMDTMFVDPGVTAERLDTVQEDVVEGSTETGFECRECRWKY